MLLIVRSNEWVAYLQSDATLWTSVTIISVLVAAVLAFLFSRTILRRVLRGVASRLSAVPSELLKDETLLSRLTLIVPVVVLYQSTEALAGVTPLFAKGVEKLALVSAVLVGLSVATRLLSKGNEIYCRYPVSRTRPIKGYVQVATIVLYILGVVVTIATALDKSPLVFLSGLGAMTAIILLVFRDTLLSLVAGVQLTTNDLIRVGDWIEMPQFGADGDVVDIALHVVKVQNWDKTITVIPTHKFLEHSFKNWRGMSEAGGRRIKRSVHVDVNTIRFLSDAEIERFARFKLLADYIASKRAELAAHNGPVRDSDPLAANVRRLTNIGTFRAYLVQYLRQHPHIHQNMTFLVRQLQPTAEGLPLEIYVFSKDTRWAVYESVQADVFDHVLAVAGDFGLKVYQRPSGNDVRDAVGLPPTLRPIES